jgi:hypothetical protein
LFVCLFVYFHGNFHIELTWFLWFFQRDDVFSNCCSFTGWMDLLSIVRSQQQTDLYDLNSNWRGCSLFSHNIVILFSTSFSKNAVFECFVFW